MLLINSITSEDRACRKVLVFCHWKNGTLKGLASTVDAHLKASHPTIDVGVFRFTGDLKAKERSDAVKAFKLYMSHLFRASS